MTDELKGNVAVITGVSSGIGRAMARSLAGRGATVYGVSRSTGDGARIVRELGREAGNPDVHFVPGDLMTLDGMRAAAASLRGFTDGVDILLNNAGGFFARRQTTADGYEATFALNHLGYFVLTVLLLPRLLAGGGARVVNTASEAQRMGRMHFDDPMMERSYSAWGAYGQSKLANLMFTVEAAARLEGTGVTVNAFHPGFVASGFASGSGWMNKLVQLSGRVFGRSPAEGADTGLYLATSPEVEGVSGAYFADRKRRELRAEARDPQQTGRLWSLSETLAHLTEEERRPLLEVSPRETA